MAPSREEVAKKLATLHARTDQGLVYVALARGEDEGELRLLEVNADSVPAGVMPVHFAADKHVPYELVVIELTPEEHELLERGELELPPGWDDLEVLYQRDGRAAK